MQLQSIPRPAKLAAAAAGGLVVAIGVIVITASALGFNLTGATHAAGQPVTATVATPSPSASPGRAPANPATRAVNQAVVQAEAQVLGAQPRDVTASLRQGTTVHQLATQ